MSETCAGERAPSSSLGFAGESVVAVAALIGDTPAMLLSVYRHVMPNTEDRARRAVDDASESPGTGAMSAVSL
jgi:hypothetical protein